MELQGMGEALSALGGVIGGVFGGMKIGRSKQLDEIRQTIEVYKDAHNFTKDEAEDLRKGLKESRDHNEKCELKLAQVQQELAEFKGFVKAKLEP